MKQITFNDGIVRLDGEELPGVMTSLRVNGQVRYDEQEVDGASGKSKIPQGWEDQTISLSLVLATDSESDCYEKLETLAEYFKKADSKANPQIFTIVNRHAQGRGIRQVVFDRLETTENDKNDLAYATLGFTEHNPPIVQVEAAAAKTPTPKELAQKAKEKAASQEKKSENTSSQASAPKKDQPAEDVILVNVG